ncbi:hypothetical protein DUI87_06004 [Hirundo rustica rustica]|uniref:Uncharacterized protein n=1 Tax=Hirundo rustica rustica TaxID=333673 RepID=A0A3M0KW86_HIRRU|nr:hypothetical protein DUI87_06004 [Hirundo rustica rustica]
MRASSTWFPGFYPGEGVKGRDKPLPNQGRLKHPEYFNMEQSDNQVVAWEKRPSHLTTTTFQEVVESDEVTSESPFLQDKQPQLPQLSLTGYVFQAPHQTCYPPLNAFKCLNVLPKLRGPELDTALKVWPHQCRVQGKNDLPAPAGHTIPDTSQNAIGLLGHLGTLLAHV